MFAFNGTANDIGVSVLLVTFDTLGVTGSGRSQFFMKTLPLPPAYPQNLEYDVSVTSPVSTQPDVSIPIRASRGYSPLLTFNNTVGSAQVSYSTSFSASFAGGRAFLDRNA